MTKQWTKRVLSLMLAVLMLFATAAPVLAKMGTGDMPFLKKGTLLEQILQRDGFIDGIWYPWFNGSTVGHNLTGNEVMAMHYGSSSGKATEWARTELDYIGADEIYRQIYNLKAMGYNMMAYSGSIFAEGVHLDLQTGDVLGIKQDYLDNARRLLNICREVGMPVVWNVYFHSSSMPNYYGMDGWHVVTRMAADKTVADHYVERFVKPLCQMLKEYQDILVMVSIADEPENEVNDVTVGDHYTGQRATYGVNRDSMLYLLRSINNMVKSQLPNVPRTIASTGGTNKSFYAELGLDLMGHNNYSNNSNMPEMDDFKSNRPAILAEYNVGGDAGESDDELTKALVLFRQRMKDRGYKGGLQWCWMHNASSNKTSYYLLTSRPESNTDFRGTVTDLRHYMDEYRAEYRGTSITLDAPVLYASKGTGLVEWIPSKRGVTMDLLRSNDGGASWTTVLSNVNQADYVGDTKKGSYKDSKTANAIYKIVVRDAAGNTAESAPNCSYETSLAHKQTYVKPTLPAQIGISYVKSTLGKDQRNLISFGMENNRPVNASENLIKDSSFEAGNGQWTSMLGGHVSVVSDSTAPDGSKSLYFNTSGTTSGDFNTKFTVSVKKNTEYVFSAWVKGAYLSSSNLGHASIGVIEPTTGKFMVHSDTYTRASREDQQIYPTAMDNEWHLRSVSFNSGNHSEVTIALYGYGSQMWLDDIALFQNGKGVKYQTEQMKTDLKINYYSDEYSCADSKCVNGNPSVEGSDYWKSGSGWDAGFLSVAGGGKSGQALKYSSISASGVYYIKWVDVEPNTNYVFSLDAKILKSGAGRIGLLTDRTTQPEDAVFLSLDRDGHNGEWFDFFITFNTAAFTRVGIAVCDLGGQALFDNIQLFKESDGTLVAKNDGHNTAGGQTGGSGNSGQSGVTTDETSDDTTEKKEDIIVEEEVIVEKNQSKLPFDLNGPTILLLSFGGTAVLIGLGVGIYFLVRAISRAGKRKAAAKAAALAAASAPAEEAPAEDAPAEETPAEE